MSTSSRIEGSPCQDWNGSGDETTEQSTVLESSAAQATATFGSKTLQKADIPLNMEETCTICYEAKQLNPIHDGTCGNVHKICDDCAQEILAKAYPQCPCCRVMINQQNNSRFSILAAAGLAITGATALLPQELTPHQRDEQLLIEICDRRGHRALRVVELVSTPMLPRTREWLVKYVVESMHYVDPPNGNELIMRALLDGGPISDACRNRVAKWAAGIPDYYHGELPEFDRGVVNLLLTNGRIEQRSLNKIAVVAAQKGCFDTVFLAFTNGPRLDESKGEILKSAAWQGRLDMIPLLATGVSQGVRLQAIALATVRGHWDVIAEIRSTP